MCVSSSCGYTYVQLTWRRDSGLALDPQRRGRDPAEKDGEIPYVTPSFQIGIQMIRFRRFVGFLYSRLAEVTPTATRVRALSRTARTRLAAACTAPDRGTSSRYTVYLPSLVSRVRCEKLTDTESNRKYDFMVLRVRHTSLMRVQTSV